MTQTPKHRLRLKALAVLLAIAAAPLAANAWTNKPVKVIVPAPPGGTMDVTARILAEAIAAEIGQPVIVENRPGAGGAIGVQALQRRAARRPDHHGHREQHPDRDPAGDEDQLRSAQGREAGDDGRPLHHGAGGSRQPRRPMT